MRASFAVAALVAGASAHYNDTISYTTEIVTAYTTYCPAATSVVHGGKTYTVTEATTLTITDCPCTVTKPVFTAPVVPTTPVVVIPTTPVIPAPIVTGVPTIPSVIPSPPIFVNSTVPVPPTGAPPAPPAGTAPAGTAPGAPAATSSIPAFTGAGNKAFAASGAGLAGLLAVAAYVL